VAELSEGELRALRSDLGLNEMGGQQANTIMQQIIDGEVDPEDLKSQAKEAEETTAEAEKTAQEEADQARQESAEKIAQQTASQATSGDGYDDMTKDELTAEAEGKNVNVTSSMTKAEIIAALRSGSANS
jgi:hypothetical protein